MKFKIVQDIETHLFEIDVRMSDEEVLEYLQYRPDLEYQLQRVIAQRDYMNKHITESR